MRILIAEDDQVLADGLLRALRASGYAVDRVSSGTEADTALATHEFDLVILDLGLPRLHGLEVLRKLRARGSTMPVGLFGVLSTRARVRGPIAASTLGRAISPVAGSRTSSRILPPTTVSPGFISPRRAKTAGPA